LCKLSHSIAEHVTPVQGHKVKYSNCNNSAADCPISLKFRTEFYRGEAGLLHMFKVKGQRSRSRGQSSRSQSNVTYKQYKRSKTATDRQSEFQLDTGDKIKADRDRGVALPQVAMHSQLPRFLVSFYSNPLFSALAQRTPIKSIREVRS